MSADYFSISSNLQQQGYEVQRIDIIKNAAIVYVSNSIQTDVLELYLNLSGGEWILSP
jgi:hypothetical protein